MIKSRLANQTCIMSRTETSGEIRNQTQNMKSYQTELLQTCIENDILRFGEYTLKSGRKSPYFFNAGLFNNGRLLARIAKYYAILLSEKITHDYMLYGPAYKGIPLVAATAMQLAQSHDTGVDYAFNRKEEKDHGEGGNIVGAGLKGNVVILDDVITAGTSVIESIELIRAAGATPCALIIALDRQETVVNENLSAVQMIERRCRIPVYALLKLEDLIAFLQQTQKFGTHFEAISRYWADYGIATDAH